MQPQIIRLNDLQPDGVRIRVSWEKMVVNASIFIPCIDTDTALKQVKNIAEEREWVITTRVQIEAGKLGVRIWRDL